MLMFTDVTVAFLFALGFSAWVYSVMYRQTGGNNKSALTVSGAAGLLGFFALWLILSLLFSG
ncbi:hypothetical protein BH23PAT1_BH23PAT1_0350 [soil metagenome]